MTEKLSKQSEGRIAYFDILKGIGIVLVVYGHCIQYGNGGEFLSGERFFEDSIFQFIYSFHMPLFMFVSGYLFHFSLQRHDARGLIASRLRSLVVPALTYAALAFVMSRYWLRASSIVDIIKYPLMHMWFLWSVFYSSIVVLVVHKWGSDKFAIHAVLMMLTFVTPDGLNLGLYKWTYFYFVAGYYLNRNIGSFERRKNLLLPAFLCVAVLFIAMFQFYDRNIFIYTTVMRIYNRDSALAQLYYDIFRIVIGFLGTFLVCLLVILLKGLFAKAAGTTRLITTLGRNSLGIYFFQSILIGSLLPRLTKSFSYSVLLPICETAVVLAACMLCINVAKRFRITRVLVLGIK